jgi:aryl-alcohol dehydrogenase-like predicted oxidoreductase
MKHRQLGRSFLQVSPLCFGGNVLGWTVDEAKSFSLLDKFVDAGLSFIDTADVYSVWAPGNEGGESETIIGRWMKARGARGKVILATKLGSKMGPNGNGLGMPGGLAKPYIRKAVEASLRRLQTDYIDIYQAHFPDPLTRVEESLEVFGELIHEGKVRFIGASNYSSAQLDEALQKSAESGLPRFESLQTHYNLYTRRRFESELEPVCAKHGLGVLTYFSLESGFLTGKYRSETDFSKSVRGGGMAKCLNSRGLRILQALDEVASAHGATPAQIALAWLMAQPVVTAPIASATSPEQLKQLIGAASLELRAADVEALDIASAES